jgi:hypothetical protein
MPPRKTTTSSKKTKDNQQTKNKKTKSKPTNNHTSTSTSTNESNVTITLDQPPVSNSSPKHIYLATPCYGCQLTNVYLTSLLGLQSHLFSKGIHLSLDLIGNESLITRARNLLVARFLKSKGTHLLFIDADIGFRSETVSRMLDFDKEIVTAVYPKKNVNWETVASKVQSQSKEPIHAMGLDFNINLSQGTSKVQNGFVEVHDSATGMMLIRRDVLEKMYDAYKEELFAVNDLQNRDVIPNYVSLFDCMIDPETKRSLSEDYAFCRRWQALDPENNKIWADLSSPLLHMGSTTFSGSITQRL